MLAGYLTELHHPEVVVVLAHYVPVGKFHIICTCTEVHDLFRNIYVYKRTSNDKSIS